MSERPVALPGRVTVAALADVCRTTALDFVNNADTTWTKRDLAAWLAGPYRTLTSFAQRRHRESERMIQVLTRVAAARPAKAAKVTGASVQITEMRLYDLLSSARHEVGITLEGLRDGELGVSFVFDALSAGYVHRAFDQDGNSGWVPVDLPRLRLVDRVASLFAVDYLLRAEDYEQRLATCGGCGKLAFEEEQACVERACMGHSESGIPGPVSYVPALVG